jgi:hypothetical protein
MSYLACQANAASGRPGYFNATSDPSEAAA